MIILSNHADQKAPATHEGYQTAAPDGFPGHGVKQIFGQR